MTRTPFYPLVPKGLQENLEWRRRALEEGRSSREAAKELWIMCSRDILFYINTFVWTHSPSEYPDNPVRPFITWAFQDDALLQLDAAIGHSDVVIRKSREMGASWMCLALFEWRWHFMEYQSFLLASRDESYVWKPGNMKALFSKLEFILAHQPGWLRPNYTLTELRLENEDTHSTINGESATGDLARGDRRTAMLWDELAAWGRNDGFRAISSTSAVTKTRIINSTPQGTGDAYHTLAQSAKNQIVLPWRLHPEKSKGLYTSSGGKLRVLDQTYVFPPNYKYILDGKVRSPYYDDFCERNPVPSIIAQELDMDFAGSGSQFFNSDMIKQLIAETVRRPLRRGELQFDAACRPTAWMDAVWGKFLLWMPLGVDDKPLLDRSYAIGVDIGLGTGASNSVISIVDCRTGEKVGEYADNHTRPEQLAKLAVAIANWLGGAFMVWEGNGPGATFGSVVLETGYRNVYYRIDETKMPHKLSDTPGFHSTNKTKQVLLSNYHIALKHGTFINRSKDALEECAEIVFLDDGTIGHAASVNVLDSSGAGDNHADRVIADALACKGLKERPAPVQKEPEREIPMGCSLASRRELERKSVKKSDMVFS